ncbi:hypothetical protein QQZ08_010783 [Neonectria magnoliae]|uniref:Infection structure specific protein n=1 Tax=Neonectria magnoliae TaxID=2732573 RepID=A0ABR1HF39_9HYPO
MHTTKVFLLVFSGALQVTAETPSATKTGFIPGSPFQTACQSVITSLEPSITDAPVPDMAISEVAVSFAIGDLYNTENPCELPGVTGRSAKLFSEWASSWTEWQSDHISEYREIWTACSDEPLVTDIVPVGSEVCSNLAARITGKADSNDDDNDDENDDSTGGNQDEEDENDDEDSDEVEQVDGSAGSRQTSSLLAAALAGGMVVAAGLY